MSLLMIVRLVVLYFIITLNRKYESLTFLQGSAMKQWHVLTGILYYLDIPVPVAYILLKCKYIAYC